MLVILALLALVMCSRYEKEWNEFKIRFGKHYDDKIVEKERFQIFKDNMAALRLYQKTDSYAIYSHLTPFMDLTVEEFVTRKTTYEPIQRHNNKSHISDEELVGDPIPQTYDWSTQGVVNTPRDQQTCGSCWAHAIVEGLESSYAIQHGVLYKLSPQQLVDCDTKDDGCDGGNLTLGEDYCTKHKIVTEDSYPYANVTQKCTVNEANGVVKAKSYGLVRGGEEGMRKALVQYGPLPIALNANVLQFYTGGILNPSNCNPKAINHAVLAVGYNLENNPPYWKIMNSWGAEWGENGYFRIIANQGKCGLDQDPTYIISE